MSLPIEPGVKGFATGKINQPVFCTATGIDDRGHPRAEQDLLAGTKFFGAAQHAFPLIGINQSAQQKNLDLAS